MKLIYRSTIAIFIFTLAFIPSAYAQDTCDPATAKALTEQLSTLPEMPNLQTFNECAQEEEIDGATGVFNYVFLAPNGSFLSVPFEISNGQPLVVATLYGNADCFMNEPEQTSGKCMLGWINKRFVETGFSSPDSEWVIVHNENPNAFHQELKNPFLLGMEKRTAGLQ